MVSAFNRAVLSACNCTVVSAATWVELSAVQLGIVIALSCTALSKAISAGEDMPMSATAAVFALKTDSTVPWPSV